MGLLHTITTRAVRKADEQNREVEKEYLPQIIQNHGYMKKYKQNNKKRTTKNKQ